MKPRTDKPCRICGEPVRYRSGGLSTRIHNQCRARKTASAPERKSPPYRLTRVARPGQAGPAQQKQPPHRNRALLDLAHGVQTCMNCGRHVEAGCEPAHANAGMTESKGLSIKANDHEHAALDPACHRWLDSGTGIDPSGRFEGTREGKRAMWITAYFRTQSEYWKLGWLKVSA